MALMHHLVENGSDGLVVCGTTGEAATLTDEEHLRVIQLAVEEMSGRCTIVAGVGSNDTNHAIELTERATALGADAMLSVTPYYARPNRRGIVRHFEEVAQATDKPIILYNIPSRTGTDMPNDLLAELAQIEHVDAVKQANNANLALVDGLELYAGNDDILCRTLELGGAGGILVASHIVGHEMRRIVDEPERRREIEAGLQGCLRGAGGDHQPDPDQSCPESARTPRGRTAPTTGGGRRARAGDGTRRCSSVTACCRLFRRERPAPRPAAGRSRRDRQEHDRRRVRRPHRGGRHRPALPHHRHARHRPRAARLHLSARARRGHRGDRDHPRTRGSSGGAAVGPA